MDSSSRTPSPTTPATPELENTDVYSMSDDVISEELDFVEEIGNGNWGSVWLVKPKGSKPISSHLAFKDGGRKFAVKLVHRKKTAANASRIKSLWNEMKIIRGLKPEQHPSIIPFHSFIITPSFAMITMTFLPTAIPVDVEESKAREWFRSLLSAIDFLHRRGVVHNDVKPANILLAHKNVPVLVDFGFAEKNDADDESSFHSNLAYGTPEYLSPERARGLTHDTRKSDVWSLGVTFFEILSGRTPFEPHDGDAFQTKEDVERYWSRTLRGKWLGKWDFSIGMEKLLRRMMSPNADLRCTAAQAMTDRYWQPTNAEMKNDHRRSASFTSSVVFEKDIDKLLGMTPPSRVGRGGNETPLSPPGLELPSHNETYSRHSLIKSKSQPKVTASKIQPRKRAPIPPVMDLSPIKASPPTTPSHTSASAKENMASQLNSQAKRVTGIENANGARRAFGAILSQQDNNNSITGLGSRIPVKKLDELTAKRRSGLFNDSRRSYSNLADGVKGKTSTNVKDRVMEWEREKQRLREMERLAELERERDEHFEREKERKTKGGEKAKEADKENGVQKNETKKKEEAVTATNDTEKKGGNIAPKTKQSKKTSVNLARDSIDRQADKENAGVRQKQQQRPSSPPMLPLPPIMSPLSRMLNTFPAPTPANTPAQPPVPTKQSKQNIFKHGIKASIDKTVQLYKSSTIGRATNGSTPARGFSFDFSREAENTHPNVNRESKEDVRRAEEVISPISSSMVSPITPLAPIKNAAMTEQAAEDTHMDRMTIWMKNVEKVVEEAQANFEAMAPRDFSLPPLPVPLSRSQSRANRSTRLPRRLLAASQIFDENGQPSPIDSSFASLASPPSSYAGPNTSTRRSSCDDIPASPVVSPAGSKFLIPEIVTPSRQRRATVSTHSPEPAKPLEKPLENSEAQVSSPNFKAKSRSQSTLARLGITPLSLDADYKRSPEPSPRLADVVDRSLFMAPPYASRDNLLDSTSFVFAREPSYDELTSSPLRVDPYPARPRASEDCLDTPDRQRLENVYDRFLMSTSGVRRCGKGYQSEHVAPVPSTTGFGGANKRDNHRAFYSTRRPMPPPVSSDDIERRGVSVDELGVITHTEGEAGTSPLVKDEGNSTVALVRRAFKAMVPGKAVVSRRLSRVY